MFPRPEVGHNSEDRCGAIMCLGWESHLFGNVELTLILDNVNHRRLAAGIQHTLTNRAAVAWHRVDEHCENVAEQCHRKRRTLKQVIGFMLLDIRTEETT